LAKTRDEEGRENSKWMGSTDKPVNKRGRKILGGQIKAWNYSKWKPSRSEKKERKKKTTRGGGEFGDGGKRKKKKKKGGTLS